MLLIVNGLPRISTVSPSANPATLATVIVVAAAGAAVVSVVVAPFILLRVY